MFTVCVCLNHPKTTKYAKIRSLHQGHTFGKLKKHVLVALYTDTNLFESRDCQ